MSAGADLSLDQFTTLAAAAAVPPESALVVQSSLGLLAPRMRDAVEESLAECERLSLNVIVFETFRSDPLQRLYYARGRTVKPPATPVTWASTNLETWHGYGLAIDAIHGKKRWDMPEGWFRAVAEVMKRHGLDWGGDWPPKKRDLPHFQWGRCRGSPSDRARELFRTGGLEAVWREVGAL